MPETGRTSAAEDASSCTILETEDLQTTTREDGYTLVQSESSSGEEDAVENTEVEMTDYATESHEVASSISLVSLARSNGGLGD